MSDLIRREDVIDELMALRDAHKADQFTGDLLHWTGIKAMLENIPSAEPERKTGKWIKVPGYASPGGDPVWKCSECGKGIHVYGIEAPSYNRDYADGQWIACPNCGADMRGEE